MVLEGSWRPAPHRDRGGRQSAPSLSEEVDCVTSCPSDETLGQLGVEIVEGPRFEELERHVEALRRLSIVPGEAGSRGKGWEESLVPIVPDRVDLPEIPGFVIEEELGRGSMGIVYRAWQPRLARRVALKVIAGRPGQRGEGAGLLAPRGPLGSPRA